MLMPVMCVRHMLMLMDNMLMLVEMGISPVIFRAGMEMIVVAVIVIVDMLVLNLRVDMRMRMSFVEQQDDPHYHEWNGNGEKHIR
ncbi:MAG: hypothetical protein A4E65_02901 [Syntrophorhabdus sp. PtaU1.Bin153]|nr:MAG: hypothetical protein A4E65_02901 [Syntrophorhabdus sp. PtaU1.Bin153]